MQTVTLARNAMATRFELVLHGDDVIALRAIGEEALNEIDRLENQLSLYRPGSEIAQLNARAGQEPVRITPTLFALLRHARQLHAETRGAFDLTIAPLVRCWGFMGGTGKKPSPGEIAEARSRIGMQHVQLDEQNCTVRFSHEGVMLDLGAIGKGYAVGQAADILREAGVASALIHGGTSTIYAIGRPPDKEAWEVVIERPSGVVMMPDNWPRTVELHNEAMSVSAVWGRSFEADGKILGHVIDPCTGEPVDRALLSAIILPSATETDALSTALLVLGPDGHGSISSLRAGMKSLLLTNANGGLQAKTHGLASSG